MFTLRTVRSARDPDDHRGPSSDSLLLAPIAFKDLLRRLKLRMRVKSLMRVVSFCLIPKISMNIKDLFGNSRNRFKKKNNR